MAQQTAVEWLVEQLRMQTPLYTKNEIIGLASEMFEEQVKTAYLKGKADGSDEREGSHTRYLDEIDYFNETYKPL